MVPNDCPVIVCVLPATGVMVTPWQGVGAGGAVVGVVSDFEQPEMIKVKNIPEMMIADLMLFICGINLVLKIQKR